MIVVRYRHESDENYFLDKMKKMAKYLDEVIECVEEKDGDYYEDDDDDEEEIYSKHGGSMSRRGRMSYRNRKSGSGRYSY